MNKHRIVSRALLPLLSSGLVIGTLGFAGCGGDDDTTPPPADGGADASGDSSVGPGADSRLDAGDATTTHPDASDGSTTGTDGSSDAGANDAASDASDAGLTAAAACTRLATATIPASAIGLATTGATITSATLVSATADGGTAAGVEYCLVLGNIEPVESAAPPIMFEVNLPSTWNGKAFHFGGGGFDGTVITGIGPSVAANDAVPPLTRGYATFGSDSGHEGGNGSFTVNNEALQNYASDQLKKTHDAAVYLIQQRYASSPKKTYFAGGSEGGREAFTVAQLWPEDYDGVIALFPAWNFDEAVLMFQEVSDQWAAPGAWPDVAKQAVLANAVLAACDAQDGVADGLVSNVKGCAFNPATVRCLPNGADTGDTCLSDTQITALQQGPGKTLSLPYTTGNGETTYPAYNVFSGGDLRYNGAGSSAPANPASFTMPLVTFLVSSWTEYAVAQSASYDYLDLDPLNPGSYQGRIIGLGSIMDMNRTNLSQFQARGGKFLLAHGQADVTLSPGSSELYYSRLVQTMGATAVSSFFKFYEIPGYAHGVGVFNASWDSITALEGWAEGAVAPTNQVTTDISTATAGRTRPMCEYPTWPKYSAGDVNSAASFTCATN